MTSGQDGLLDIEVARGMDEVRQLEERWRSMQASSITADFDHFHTVIESEPNMHEPVVLTVRRDGVPVSMVLARVEDTQLLLKFGYRSVYSPSMRSLAVVSRGFLGALDRRASARVVDALTGMLDSRDLDAVTFRRLSLDHPLFQAATTTSRVLMRQHYTRITTCWERSLPATLEEFMASLSKSTRAGVKRYANKLERDYTGRLEVRKLTDSDDLDDYFRDADAVAARSYQRGLGVGVRDEPAQRLRARLAARRGWFRSYVLYLDRTPVAFCGGEAYGGRFYYGIPGYDPRFRDYRVGQYVLLKMIADLCEDDAVHVLDFGPGDAEYKRRFGDRSWEEAEVHIFAPRVRPILINLARTTILHANDVMAAAARSLRISGKVKQAWRSRVTSYTADNDQHLKGSRSG